MLCPNYPLILYVTHYKRPPGPLHLVFTKSALMGVCTSGSANNGSPKLLMVNPFSVETVQNEFVCDMSEMTKMTGYRSWQI